MVRAALLSWKPEAVAAGLPESGPGGPRDFSRPPARGGLARRALSGLLLVGACAIATPASALVLISNIDQTATENSNLGSFDLAQAFTAGDNRGGYRLTSVDVKFRRVDDASASYAVGIWRSDEVVAPNADTDTIDDPHNKLSDLTCSLTASDSDTNITCTAPGAGAGLGANTTYLFVMDSNNTADNAPRVTASDAEDDGGQSGWSIADARLSRPRQFVQNTSWSTASTALVIRINGTLRNNAAPTAADRTRNMSEDSQISFTAANFNFTDTDSGDTLRSVRITRLESAGDLELNGTDVRLNQVISKADLDADRLTFRPDPNGNGSPYANFQFKVNDGFGDSDQAYTMTINVTPIPDAPTAADSTVELLADTAYTFQASDFNFSDVDDGDTLDSVRITGLESAGDLELNGVDVTANQTISKADIDANRLKFTPATGAIGSPYANFKFRVNDGTIWSTSDSTMTINVLAQPVSVLVGNTGQGGITSNFAISVSGQATVYSQEFTTGENSGGYRLEGAELFNTFSSLGTSTLAYSVSVCALDSSGDPDTSDCDALTAPSNFITTSPGNATASGNVFTAPADTVLSASTTYSLYVVPTAGSTANSRLHGTSSTGEDTGGESGWMLADAVESRPGSGTAWTAQGGVLRVRLRGAVPATRPLAPDAPMVSADGATSLAVTWTAPENTGRPAITDYEVRYCRGTMAECTLNSDFSRVSDFTGTETSTTITGLAPSSLYQVQVRAVNSEGAGAWSASGEATTEAVPATVPVLIGNSGQADSDGLVANNFTSPNLAYSQEFTTGANPDGYLLQSVRFDTFSSSSDHDISYAASVCSLNNSGNPDTSDCTALTAPENLVLGSNTFTAPADTVLSAETTYSLYMPMGAGNSATRLRATDSNAEDGGGATGWKLADAVRFRNPPSRPTWANIADGRALELTILGTEILNPTTTTAALVGNVQGTVNIEASPGLNDQATVTLGRPPTPTPLTVDPHIAQEFTTGTHLAGYLLDSVELFARSIRSGQDYAASVCPLDGSGDPDHDSGDCAALESPDSYDSFADNATDGHVFAVPSGTTLRLSASTTYSLYVRGMATAGRLRVVTTGDEDAGSSEGWSIADTYQLLTNSAWSNPAIQRPVKLKINGRFAVNSPPVIRDFSDNPFADTATITFNENTTPGAGLGDFFTTTDADGDTVTLTLEGEDAAAFEISPGELKQIRTRQGVVYDFETKPSYTVTIKADDGKGGADTVAVTLNLANLDEPPAIPAAPTVTTPPGLPTGLVASWVEPANTGPPITSYRVQYCKGTTTQCADSTNDFTNSGYGGTATSTTITGLDESSEYQVQVQAWNAESTDTTRWSPSGTGSTGVLPAPGLVGNTSRAASDGPQLAEVGNNNTTDENFAQAFVTGPNEAGYLLQSVETFTTDDDGDTSTGSSQPRHRISVCAVDGSGDPDTTACVAQLTAPGSWLHNGHADVVGNVFTAPAATVLSADTTYSLYITSGASFNSHLHVVADGMHDDVIEAGWSLADNYRVRADDTSAWGDPAPLRPLKIRINGRAEISNAAPEFSPATAARSVPENSLPGVAVGDVLPAATDAEGDAIAYSMGGADATAFAFNASSRQISTTSGVTYDREAKAEYTVTITAEDVNGGTGELEVTISLGNVVEPPGTPAAPTVAEVAGAPTSLEVGWTAPDNMGPPITAYNLRSCRVEPTVDCSDPVQYTETLAFGGTASSTTITGLAEGAVYYLQVRATSAEGASDWSASGIGVPGGNEAPTFASAPQTFTLDENIPPGATVGAQIPAATDPDGDTLTYTLEGTDADAFAFDPADRILEALPNVDYDFEAKPSYTVTVRADDGKLGIAELEVTINLTDVDEPPGAPAAPTVGPAAGSIMGVDVSWRPPENDGPPVEDYDLRWCLGMSAGACDDEAEFTEHDFAGAATRATIDGLEPDAPYQVQVRAHSAEGTSGWSASGVGRTVATAMATGKLVGNAVGNDGFGGGPNMRAGGRPASQEFTTGPNPAGYLLDQVDTLAQRADVIYDIRVCALAGGDPDLDACTELMRPRAFRQAFAGTTSGNVFTAPAGTVLSAATGYSLYFVGASESSGSLHVVNGAGEDLDSAQGWSLANRFQTYDSGAGTWVDGVGNRPLKLTLRGRARTVAANHAPEFDDHALARAIDENPAPGAAVGEPLPEAADADGHALTYSLAGADAAEFDFDAETRQIQARPGVAYDFETRSTYTVEIRADDGAGGADAVTVTITLNDVLDVPAAPAAPTVIAPANETTVLVVSWAAPANPGSAITDYDVQYCEGTPSDCDTNEGPNSDFAALDFTGTGTSATITGLTQSSEHQVQVRATNGEGTGAWSASGSGSTGTQGNNLPAFDDDALQREVAENSASGAAVGAPIPAATDTDDTDTLTYSMEGVDAGAFAFDATARQIQTAAGTSYDHEARAAYTVTIKVDDGRGGADTVVVTIGVTDVEEAPGAPAAPTVRATAGATDSLDVSWTAPANTGPPIATYAVRWCAGAASECDAPADFADSLTVTTTSATLAGLAMGTLHQVQVQATSVEGAGDWSASGEGRTATPGNTAPVFAAARLQRRVDADSAAGVAVGAPIPAATDADGDVLAYRLDGADAPAFAFDSATRQISTAAGVTYNAAVKATYTVLVRADDGRGGTAEVEVRIFVAGLAAPTVQGAPAFAGTAAALKIGDTVAVTATFDQAVSVTTSATARPQLALAVGAATRQADYVSGSGGATLRFEYVVAEGDLDADGLAIPADALTAPADSAIVGAGGGPAATLDHPAVPADPARPVDGVRPRLGDARDDARVDETTLTLRWSEALDESSPPTGAGGFSLFLDGAPGPTVAAVAIDGSTVTLELDAAVAGGAAGATLDYAPQGATPVRDLAGNAALAFADRTVSAGPDTEPPQLLSAVVYGAEIRLAFNEALDPNSIPNQRSNGFKAFVHRDGVLLATYVNLEIQTALAPDGSTVLLTLPEMVRRSDVVTLEYNTIFNYDEGENGPLQDLATPPNRVPYFERGNGITLDNRTLGVVGAPTFASPAGTYATGDAIAAVVTFGDAVTLLGLPDFPPQLSLRIGGETLPANYVSGTGTDTLRFEYVVAHGDLDEDGISTPSDALILPDGSRIVAAAADAGAVQLTHPAAPTDPTRRVDGVPPSVVAADVVGPILKIIWSETLDESVAPTGAGGFRVLVDDADGPAVTSVSVSGDVATLVLDARIAYAETGVTLEYAPPGGEQSLRDLAGNTVRAFPVLTELGDLLGVQAVFPGPDFQAPQVIGARVGGATLEVMFDEELDPNAVPAAPAGFAVTVARGGGPAPGYSVTALSLSENGRTLTLTLSQPVRGADVVTLEYNGTLINGALQDLGEPSPNLLRNFTGADAVMADNVTPSLIDAPAFAGADGPYAIGDTVTVEARFDEAVRVTGVPVVSLAVGVNTRSAAYVAGDGTDTLRFAYVIVEGDSDADGIGIGADAVGTPAGSAIVALDDGADVSISHDAVAEDARRAVDGVRPTVLVASAAGPTVTLTWSELLDPASRTTGAGGFRVLVDGQPGPAVDEVSISGLTATLRLAAALADGTPGVTLDYLPPATPVRDLAGNAAVAISGRPTTVGPDTRAPQVSGAPTLSATQLELRFDEALDANSVPAAPGGFALSVLRRGSPILGHAASGLELSADGLTLTLTVAPAVRGGDVVTLDYAPPAQDPLRDRAATPNPVAAFAALPVDNRTPAVRGAPAFAGPPAALNIGATVAVVVTFTEAVQVTGAPELALEVGAERRLAGYVSGTGTDALRFAYTIAEGDADADGLAIPADALDTPAGSAIATQADGSSVVLDHVAVAADPARPVDGVRPTVTEARAAGSTVTVTWSEPLDETPPAGDGGFSLRLGDADGPAVATVSISGPTATLELDAELADGATGATLEYAGAAIRDLAGNAADPIAPADPAAVAVRPDTRAPEVSGAPTVRRAALKLVFDEPLDAASIPAAPGGFAVTVMRDGGPAPGYVVDGLVLSGDGAALTLILSDAVRPGDAVSVAYAAPAQDPLQDRAATPNALAAFTVDVTIVVSDLGITLDDVSSLPEGGGARALTATVALLTGPRGGPVSATVAVDAGTAQAEDFQAQPAPLAVTIPVGSLTATATFTLTPVDDDLDEEDETVLVGVTAPGLVVDEPIELTIVDDDTRGATVSPTALELDEGAQGTYAISLDSRPSAPVTVTVTASGSDSVTAAPASLVFTESDWSVAQQVTVAAAQDPGPDNETAAVAHAVSGGDYGANGVTAAPVSVSVLDDDRPSEEVRLSVTPDRIAEGAGAATLTVTGTLNAAARDDDMTVTLTIPTADGYAATGATLTIAAGAALGRARLTLEPVDDDFDRTDLEATIDAETTAIATLLDQSTQPMRLAPAALTVTIADDDERGVTVTPTALAIAEGDSATYEVALDSAPDGGPVLVTPSLADDDPAAATGATLSPPTLTFTDADWDAAQTVTVSVADDAVAELDASATATHSVAGADYGASDVTAASVTVTVPGFEEAAGTVRLRVPPDGAATVPDGAAQGGLQGIEVRLPTRLADEVVIVRETTEPTRPQGYRTGDALVDITLDNEALTPGETATVCLPTAAQRRGQRVYRYDDSASPPEWVELPPPTGGSPAGLVCGVTEGFSVFALGVASDLELTLDNVSPLPEGGGARALTATVTLLTGARSAPLTVPLSVGGGTASAEDFQVRPTPLAATFPAGRTTATARFTLTPVDDGIDEDDETLQVALAAPASLVASDPVELTIVDDDTRGVAVSPTVLALAEGAQGTYTVRLGSQPSAPVTVTVTASGSDSVTAAPASLVFTGEDWRVARQVTVAAAQDPGPENETATVAHAVSGGDYGANGVTAAPVAVTVMDDDRPSDELLLSVTPDRIAEDGGATPLTVTGTLNASARADEMTVALTASGALGAARATLTIAAGATSATVRLTVDPVDDDVDRADLAATIAAATDALVLLPEETAPRRVRLAPAALTVTVADDDERGVTVAPTALETREGDGETYAVALRSAPDDGAVTVTVTWADDDPARTTDVSASPTRLTFTAGDWNMPQTVTVTANDDRDVELDATATVSHAVAGADYGANQVTAASVAVTVPGFEERDGTVRLRIPPDGTTTMPGGTSLANLEGLEVRSESLTAGVLAVRSTTTETRPRGHQPGDPLVDLALEGAALAAGATATVCLPTERRGRRVFRYDDSVSPAQWVELPPPAGDPSPGLACGVTERFSVFALGAAPSDVAKGWLARFGRTVATQVVEAIGARLSASATGPAQLDLGGSSLQKAALSGVFRALSGRQAVDAKKTLAKSSFVLPLAEDGGRSWTAWGRGAYAEFDGEENGTKLDGEVATGTVGMDLARGGWLAGVAVSHSEGEGDSLGADGDAGEMEISLTSVNPYARIETDGGLSAWGTTGFGTGDLERRRDGVDTEVDLEMQMLAGGVEGPVGRIGSERGIFDLTLKADALAVRMDADGEADLPGVEADAQRLRLLLAGRGYVPMESGAMFPHLEAGMRWDEGDAETGLGLEMGAALQYMDAGGRFGAELRARGMLAHEESSYDEWGVSGAVTLRPDRDGRGLSLRLQSGYGPVASGTRALWARRDLAGLAPNASPAFVGHLGLELGYGLDGAGGRGTWTPYLAYRETTAAELRVGTRLDLGEAMRLELSALRRKERQDIEFRLQGRW